MKKDTSWKQVGKWYDEIASKGGHTFHQKAIFPELKKWVKFKDGDAILDLGCGQGILARELAKKSLMWELMPQNLSFKKPRAIPSTSFIWEM